MRIKKKPRKQSGAGIINKLIDKLPFELHIPGYQFCGPGTKLDKRLARGDTGINQLDTACKAHDIAYSSSKSLEDRHLADKVLGSKAWQRFKSPNASLGERLSALAIAGTMKAKVKMGSGVKTLAARKPKNKKKQRKPRKLGGFLPLIPILAGKILYYI